MNPVQVIQQACCIALHHVFVSDVQESAASCPVSRQHNNLPVSRPAVESCSDEPLCPSDANNNIIGGECHIKFVHGD